MRSPPRPLALPQGELSAKPTERAKLAPAPPPLLSLFLSMTFFRNAIRHSRSTSILDSPRRAMVYWPCSPSAAADQNNKRQVKECANKPDLRANETAAGAGPPAVWRRACPVQSGGVSLRNCRPESLAFFAARRTACPTRRAWLTAFCQPSGAGRDGASARTRRAAERAGRRPRGRRSRPQLSRKTAPLPVLSPALFSARPTLSCRPPPRDGEAGFCVRRRGTSRTAPPRPAPPKKYRRQANHKRRRSPCCRSNI